MCQINSRIMLFVEEMSQTRPKGPAEVAFATWCVGARVDDMLYVTQVSKSNLLAEDEVLAVKITDCQRIPVILAGFTQYTFSTEPDQLPSESHKLKTMLFDELSEEIQRELDRAIFEYQTHWVA